MLFSMRTPYQTQLHDAKSPVRAFLRLFSDQRLAEVYAFNQDGHMHYADPCTCLCGVFSAKSLHIRTLNGLCPESISMAVHYDEAKYIEEGYCAERGYALLGAVPGYVLTFGEFAIHYDHTTDTLRRVRLSPMIRAEMRRRERLLLPSQELQECAAIRA